MPYWLWKPEVNIPLFVSRRQIGKYKNPKRAITSWALDSGGFTVLSKSGEWDITPKDYAKLVRFLYRTVGKMDFAAIQDYMCEPFVLKKTGLTIEDHINRTVQSFIDLSCLDPALPWLPVVQGFTLKDYVTCVERYLAKGVDLTTYPSVGVGSVCRRQNSSQIEVIIKELCSMGLSLHGFGVKIGGIGRYAKYLKSSDSMAWSRNARWEPPLDGCLHPNCANCLKYALIWRNKVISKIQETGL